MADIDLVQPWRKSFPLAKPPIPGDKADAARFALEFEEGLDAEDAGQGWTLGDVARGDHDGGLAAGAAVIPMAGGAAAVRARRERDTRRKKLMSKLFQYLQDKSLVATLRNQPHGEAAWREYKRLEIGQVTEASADTIKERMRALRLPVVGYNHRTVEAFKQRLTELNTKIEPAAARMDEHDIAVLLLKAIQKCGVQSLATEATTEYTCDPANRRFQQPAPNPTHLRSLNDVSDHFHRMWEAMFNADLIPHRAPSNRSEGLGNSTRVDANEVIFPDMQMIDGFEQSLVSMAMSADPREEVSIDELRDAFVAALNATGGDRRTSERICFNCFGAGHTVKGNPGGGVAPCPSPPNNGRSLQSVLTILTALAAKGNRRGQLPSDELPIRGQNFKNISSLNGRGKTRHTTKPDMHVR